MLGGKKAREFTPPWTPDGPSRNLPAMKETVSSTVPSTADPLLLLVDPRADSPVPPAFTSPRDLGHQHLQPREKLVGGEGA